MQVGFPKIKLSAFTLCLSNISQDFELNHCMITTAQAAYNPDVTNQFAHTAEQQLRHCIPSAGAVYHFVQEDILNLFQEPSGLPTVCHATFPADQLNSKLRWHTRKHRLQLYVLKQKLCSISPSPPGGIIHHLLGPHGLLSPSSHLWSTQNGSEIAPIFLLLHKPVTPPVRRTPSPPWGPSGLLQSNLHRSMLLATSTLTIAWSSTQEGSKMLGGWEEEMGRCIPQRFRQWRILLVQAAAFESLIQIIQLWVTLKESFQ